MNSRHTHTPMLDDDGQWSSCVVVFVDNNHIWWLRWLRRGFRHCFAILIGDQGCVVVDPLSHCTRITLLPPMTGQEVADFYAQHGHAVVTPLSPCPRRLAPIRPYSCVEAVKRILGLRDPRCWTPWQLFLKLNKGRTKSVDEDSG